jgi:hypothetical protein
VLDNEKSGKRVKKIEKKGDPAMSLVMSSDTITNHITCRKHCGKVAKRSTNDRSRLLMPLERLTAKLSLGLIFFFVPRNECCRVNLRQLMRLDFEKKKRI